MKYTEKKGLRLPENEDKFDIDDLNYNFTVLDADGGGSQPIGTPVGILSGTAESVVGIMKEVTE
ncbi:MAG: hypothetical protein IJ555_00480 [Ruminococcus sp.]|nr:hypothetical protein [Ruminococcus sp.]